MANLSVRAQAQMSYDAIVIGSGITGGWAAKELCEKGLKTLVLERGRMVKHVDDYPTMNLDPWDMPGRGAQTPEQAAAQHVQRRSGFVDATNAHFFVNDVEHPYREAQRFDWIRGYQVGGRSLIWGRQCYRWSDLDFTANARDGVAVDWPIRYADIEPWYDYVERFVGVSGERLGLAHLPDGQFLKPMELNCLERHAKSRIEAAFPGRRLTIGRVAHLTEPINGRGTCQYRNRCGRGCPFGAYFSSNAVTLPAAEATGNLTLRSDAIVTSLVHDEEKRRVTGVRVMDANTGETVEYTARIVFCNASTVNTTALLLNSTSARFPNGLGNDSGELGHNMMDHHYFVGAMGSHDGFADEYYKGRRPNGVYIPRYRHLTGRREGNYLRGYGYQGGAGRGGPLDGTNATAFGAAFKDGLFQPGGWGMMLNGFGEILPDHRNRMTLDRDARDRWGQPTVSFDCRFVENDLNMRRQMQTDAAEMLEAAGIRNILTFDYIGGMGKGVHEMGTARMGRDPKTSVLNARNQLHAVPNVFVTDGSCMTSASCVNPSLTYMALTARACDFAVSEIKKGNL
jgi:choline dehydrogenase-like flavoprotein